MRDWRVRSEGGQEATSPPLALALFADSAVVRGAAFTQLPNPLHRNGSCDMTEHKPMERPFGTTWMVSL